MRRMVLAVCLALAGGSGMGLAAHPAVAASLCVGNGPGCKPTLQAALSAANPGDVIHLGAGIFPGPISIVTSVAIIGAGPGATTIQGGGDGPVVTIGTFLGTSQPTVGITGVTITGGDNTTVFAPLSAQGGGITVPPPADGSAPATVTLTNSIITGNRSEPSDSADCGLGCTFSGAIGGGIVNYGSMTLNATAVSSNSASVDTTSASTDIFAIGGGIGNAGTLTIHGGTIANNTVSLNTATAVNLFGSGGGIDSPGALTITGSTISGNSVTESSTSTDPTSNLSGAGGGVHVSGGQATILGTQITGNRVTDTGYGGFVGSGGGGIDDDGALTLQGSTVSNNHTTSTVTSTTTEALTWNTSGGMEVDGSATIRDTTFSGNVATSTSPAAMSNAPNPSILSIGGALAVFGTVSMTDSTVTGNRAIGSTTSGSVGVGGGGIANVGTLTLRDTTVSYNMTVASGPGGDTKGGGIWNETFPGGTPPQLTLIDSTITHNSLTGSPHVNMLGGGLYNGTNNGANVTSTNSVVAQNTPDNCYPPSVLPGC